MRVFLGSLNLEIEMRVSQKSGMDVNFRNKKSRYSISKNWRKFLINFSSKDVRKRISDGVQVLYCVQLFNDVDLRI